MSAESQGAATLGAPVPGLVGPHSGTDSGSTRRRRRSEPVAVARDGLEATSYQRLREHLAYLQMSAAAEHLSAELDRGFREKASATQVLERLLEIEVEATRARRQRGRLRFARYPVHKTLADFDLDFQPSIDRAEKRLGVPPPKNTE